MSSHVGGAPTMARATKTSQGNQLASAPYKHRLHGKDPVLITHNITQINPKNNFP